MKPVVRNTIAVLIGLIVGNVINMSLIQVGSTIFPTGIDTNDMEALGAFMKDADTKYFIFPFLAHAIGTLTGAFAASLFSKNRKLGVALIIGAFFQVGGIIVSFIIPAPAWFVSADLIVAYFPMAFIGFFLAKSLRKRK